MQLCGALIPQFSEAESLCCAAQVRDSWFCGWEGSQFWQGEEADCVRLWEGCPLLLS